MKLSFVLLWILWTSVSSQTSEFTQHPVSMNYIKGDEFLFTCSATNVDALVFLANGTQPSADQEFIQTQSIIPDGLSTSSLTGMALIQHNNTNISCVGPVFGEDEVISRIAVLLVQGPLSSVVGLSYSFINSSTVNITWSPPFTLPGTNIIGYNISVAANASTVEAFTSNNYIEITVSSCDETVFTVSGYNGLDGESSTILLDTFSIQSITLNDTVGPVIVVVCIFHPNTAAVGCLIQLILLTDNIVQYNSTSNRTGDQAIVILSGVTTGCYQLRVFEVESDQSLVLVSHLEEELTIIESVTISTLIMSSTTMLISPTTMLISPTTMLISPTATITVSPANTDSIVNSLVSSVDATDTSQTVITGSGDGNNNNLPIIGAVVGVILLLVAVVSLVIILLVFGVLVLYNRNRSSNKNNKKNMGTAVRYSNRGGIEQVIIEER